MEDSLKYTLITGASSGIGKALAYNFASKGHNLIISARRRDLLDAIQKDIKGKHKVDVIVLEADLLKDSDVTGLYNAGKQYDIDVFINNAGFGDFSYPWDIDMEKAERMVGLNVNALSKLSLLYVRDYCDKDATLINVSSVGGYYQFTVAVTYCATKFYVSSLTEGFARALQAQGKPMRAKVLAPSATSTEFMDRANEDAAINGNDILTDPSVFISAEQLAEYGYELFKSDKVVGIVNGENKLELKDPIYPAVG